MSGAPATPKRERGVGCAVKLELPAAKASLTADLLKAIGEPARLQMILALRASPEPICVCDFTDALGLSQPTVSHHLARLRSAGLVESTRRGIWTYYRLRLHLPEAVRRIVDALP